MASLHIHPVKSCRGVDVRTLALDARGPVGDRRFMVVDASARFVTQRDLPRMATIGAALVPGGVALSAPGAGTLSTMPTERRLDVTVWDYVGSALDCGDVAAAWLEDVLGAPCRLVHFPKSERRMVESQYAPDGGEVAFADAFPLLVTSQASLDALNARLDAPVGMSRFRPNVVIDGCDPHAEDGWRRVRLGAVLVDVVKACERCSIPSVDPASGRRGKQPLRALSEYRRGPDGAVTFGQNAVHRQLGTITVGDRVEIIA